MNAVLRLAFPKEELIVKSPMLGKIKKGRQGHGHREHGRPDSSTRTRALQTQTEEEGEGEGGLNVS